MRAAAVAKQTDTEMGAEIMRVIMALGNVEASLSDPSFTEIESTCVCITGKRS
jgi:hypothetical protein